MDFDDSCRHGVYSVDESGGPSGYAKSLSTDCSGTLALGEVKTCTITNDDIAPQLTVTKTVEFHSPSCFARGLDSRQQQRNEHCDDGNDD